MNPPHLFVEFRGIVTLVGMRHESALPRCTIFLDCLTMTLAQLLSMMRGHYDSGYHVEVTVPLNSMQKSFLLLQLERNDPVQFATMQKQSPPSNSVTQSGLNQE